MAVMICVRGKQKNLCVEVRKQDGSEFTPNTLYHIVCGIMRYLRWNGHPAIDFFTDPEFIPFRSHLMLK